MGHVTEDYDIKGDVTTPNLLNVIDIKEVGHKILQLVYWGGRVYYQCLPLLKGGDQ